MPWEPLPSNPERDPSPIGESLDRLSKRLGAPSAGVVGSLFSRWSEVVGDSLADHAQPIAIRDGTLLVSVDDPAWAPQLRFLEKEVLERVRETLGVADVVRLQVRVSRASGPQKEPRGPHRNW